MTDHAIGGNDSLTAGGGLNTFYGDAGGTMSGFAQGGNDTFKGGAPAGTRGVNLAYGDALAMSGNAHGGNDKLVGGDDANPAPAGTFDNTLIGDAQSMSGRAVGGNDKLVSGTGNDDMWGDAQSISGNAKGGNDTYVFNFSNGHDKIEDFGQVGSSILGNDHIDVSALGIEHFSQLQISAFDPTTHDSTITFSSGNDVVVHSQIALTSHDFLFA
jgi:Ca2+-binding RTX toxin-like protein